MLCLNVGTVAAIHAAVIEGRPLISRITTLTGAALSRPMNVEALIGTPVGELMTFAGLQEAQLDRLLLGGPMMGFSLPSLEVPLIKTSNCLLASTASELPAPPPALPCIRCGDCAEVCPASLLPQQLHFFALGQQHEQLKAHHLFDCIECGACAYVCPSSIPLVQYYRAAKAEIRELENKQLKAEQSRQRFEQRQERLRCEQEQKDAERQARTEKAARARAALAANQTATEPGALAAAPAGLSDEQKKLKIAASMAQVTLKKAEKQLALYTDKGGDTSELQAQVAQLRGAALLAQNALDAALATATPTAAIAPAADAEQALKKAKIEVAMLRAQLRKLEQLQTPNAEQVSQLQGLRSQLTAAEKALESLPSQPPSIEPAPASPAMQALKQAKIALAMRRAELKKAEQAGAEGEQLTPLRAALAAAEQSLHAAEDA
ncbi:MAG: RnfABCDGE type electron transport complex subunit C, partial [Lacisediminimonas sp.]|nr:RnfABCDGE type electron transport complex subunit C [Lacisediminimonas sp.]